MNKQETTILERIEKDIKEIKELVKNPKNLIKNEVPTKYPITRKEISIKDPNSPATEKQKEYLIEVRYMGDVEKLNKIEASKLIEHYVKNKGNKSQESE